MEKLQSYEQYAQVLAAFKEGRARCGTNKMQTREELTALIEAGKLYYEQIGDTMWFFTNEGYFYTGVFYVPKDRPIEMRKQDMDVVVELFGKEDRYNQQWEDELIAAGFDKGDKRVEYAQNLDETIGATREINKLMRRFWERNKYVLGTAKITDYTEVRALLRAKIGLCHYTVTEMTDKELEEMERSGRCVIIYDEQKKICAVALYIRRGRTAYRNYVATLQEGSGLGAWVGNEATIKMYEEGCKKAVAWVRVDNVKSISFLKQSENYLTEKYYWQFILPAAACGMNDYDKLWNERRNEI